jgi:hypothetical protein
MAYDMGLGGGGRPVPVQQSVLIDEPLLAYTTGDRVYVPPTSSGQIMTQPVQYVPSVVYSDSARVVQAYHNNIISYHAAYGMLVSDFGMSGMDATEALTTEKQQYLDPEIVVEEEPVSVVSEPDISDTSGAVVSAPSKPLFENFELIGLVAVVGALWMMKKRW